MKCNVGKADRIIRLLVAITATVLLGTGVVQGAAAVIAGVVAVAALATAALSRCGLYYLLGLNTKTD